MSLREVQPGEENLPTCMVCGAMVKDGKCLSCGGAMSRQDRARERLKLMASKGYYLSGCDSNVTNIIVGYMCEFSDAENAELRSKPAFEGRESSATTF